MDMPPTPPAHVQVVTQQLLDCGIRRGDFTIKGRGQAATILFKRLDATPDRLDCIRAAVGPAMVEFESAALEQAYEERLFEAARPAMLAHAKAELEKHGALKNFPERSAYASDALFAEALERHCGLRPGAFFANSQGGLIVQPALPLLEGGSDPKLSCLMSAVMYVTAKGEGFSFGVIGNEAETPER
ncbi:MULTISPECIES: hypothetical protein [unclassified Sphingomonas]|uniref:hypothetical protein n=1 Tax=unclassified Sphingomonas TaxID=196159 RepID=UPI0006F84C50|nr:MULTISPECIES: hypothetical protein [unclassified Sphingomonas]KQM62206.1 hypothetical protein ASE65_04125 [Sphingomonas sp. Leaf16]KQN13610.1 hypothetical protein ASE81_04195 [Sphingomonas sp. Leaf29]KQN23158.1 hypothetical protein ASE83_01215 [Sphingomonas sp. Leaf32]